MHSVLGENAFEWLGSGFKILLSAQETSGALSVVDSVSPPGYSPPRHIHHAEDETFVVLTGDVEVWLEGERFMCSPGSTAFVPRDREHTFRVVGNRPSRHLVILTPGGFEAFFREMGRRGLRIPQDMAQIGDSAARHHLSFTGPPLDD